MDVDTTKELHGIVIKSAFKAMISNPNKVLVNTGDNKELSLNRNVLILFSPLIRNILSSVSCCTTPTMYLPDIATLTIIKLSDILNKGISGDFWDVKEGGEVLEAASALGIDMTRLHYGAERQAAPGGEIFVNIDDVGDKSRQMKKVFDQKKSDGKEIVFISKSTEKSLADKDASNNPGVAKESISDNSASTRDSHSSSDKNVPVKSPEKEPRAQVEKTQPNLINFSARSSQELVVSSINTQSNGQFKNEADAMEEIAKSLEEPMEQILTNPANTILISSITTDTEVLKYQCKKCEKAFVSITLLRYHYCSHFRGILKKRFANMIHDNKCLECRKTFPNHGRLLLHIGVQHDKINEILKSKGIEELPPSATAAAHGGGLNQHTEAQQAAETDMENIENQTSATSTRNIKIVPLFSAHRPPLVDEASNQLSSYNLSQTSISSLNKTFSMMSNTEKTPTNPNTTLENNSSATANRPLLVDKATNPISTVNLSQTSISSLNEETSWRMSEESTPTNPNNYAKESTSANPNNDATANRPPLVDKATNQISTSNFPQTSISSLIETSSAMSNTETTPTNPNTLLEKNNDAIANRPPLVDKATYQISTSNSPQTLISSLNETASPMMSNTESTPTNPNTSLEKNKDATVMMPPIVDKTTNQFSTSSSPQTLICSLNEAISSTMSNTESTPTNANKSLDKNNDATAGCNYELKCQVCDQQLKTISAFEQHCCRHFMKDLQDQYSNLMDGLKCNICYNSFKQKHNLLVHIGCKHGKINNILRQNNYAALPCPVTNTSSEAMQKQLVKIKKERMEQVDRLRSEVDELSSACEASSDLLNKTLPVDEGTYVSMLTLD